MDTSDLVASLLETFISFWLNLFLDGLFGFITDLLFGGPYSGLV